MKLNVKLLTVCFMLCGMLFGINQAFASHAAGADLTYSCLGNNQYQISLNFYRDCDGISAPTSASVSFSSSCGSVSNLTLTRVSGTGVEVSQLCPSQLGSSACNGGSLPGIQQYTYTGVVTLPAACVWTVRYALCCRNAAVTNLNNADNFDLFVEATINNTNGLCNNSPIFTSLPVPYLCNNNLFFYNHGAVDVDGDSLFYTMVQPRDAANAVVPYNAGRSVASPMNTSGGFNFDPFTGQMSATPTGALQNAVIAVRVDEYRNNVLIGTTIRDMQFIVINCSANTVPQASGVDGNPTYIVDFCTGVPNCFDIFTSDPDATQTVTISWNSGIPGATFTSSGGSRPTGTFCWTPTINDVGNKTFTVLVQDDACPSVGSQIFSYTVRVGGLNINVGPDTTLCASSFEITPSLSNGSGVLSYNWSTGDTTLNLTVTQSGLYTLTVTDGVGCSGVDAINVTLSQTGSLSLFAANDTTVCPGQPATFDAGAGFAAYLWSTQANTQTITTSTPGVYSVTVTDQFGCQNIDSIELINNNSLTVDLGADTSICANETLTLDAGAGFTYLWSTGETTQTIDVSLAGTYDVVITDALGCTAFDSVSISTLPVPTVNLGPDRFVCQPPYRISYRSTGNNTLLWNTGETTPFIDVTTSGTYVLSVTDPNGCTGTDSITITFTSLVDLISYEDTSLCAGETLTIAAFPGFTTYMWSNGETTANIDVTTTDVYTLVAEDPNGCIQTDTVNVTFTPGPVVDLGADIPVCDSGAVVTFIDAGAGFASYQWSNGNNVQVLSAASVGTYSVTVTDANGCTDADTVEVFVAAPPVVDLGADDTICVGSRAVLDAGAGFATYSWSDGSTSRTLAAATAGLYSVTVTDANGCSASDEVEIATELCCFPASFGNQFTLIDATNNTVTSDEVWEGKYYITANVIVSGTATLDLTNVDLVFLEDAGIIFRDFARVRAHNSVFRSCDEGQSWLGFDFRGNSSGTIDESSFLNAAYALDIRTTGAVNVTSSTFRNYRVGIYLNNAGAGDYKGAITNNTFVSNDDRPTYLTNTGATVTSFFGIQMYNTLSSGLISQNAFINSIQDNTTDLFHGVYINNSRVTVSANTFTNLSRALDVTGNEFTTFENNKVEYTFRSYVDLFAARISNASTVLIQGNEFDYSALGASPSGGWLQTAIVVSASDNVIIANNNIYGFSRTIRVIQNSSFVSITDNVLDGSRDIAILVRDGVNYSVSGNTITNAANVGIFAFQIEEDLLIDNNDIDGVEIGIHFSALAGTNVNGSTVEILDNCVRNTTVAMYLSTVDANTVPTINNNYLYNYTGHGIWSNGFTGTIGDCANYPADAGRNSFVSNYLAPFGSALDVRSDNAVLFVQGNSANLVTNFPNVLINTACNTTSNAGCGNQIGNNEGGGRLASPLLMLYKNIEAAYPLAVNADNYVAGDVSELNAVAVGKRLDYVVNIMHILAANATMNELNSFYNSLTGSSVLNANDMNYAAYTYNTLKGEHVVARGFLSNYTATTADAQDLKVIEGIRNQLLVDGRSIQDLTDNEMSTLKAIDDARKDNAPIARDMVQTSVGHHDYIFTKDEVEEIPNTSATSAITLNEDFLNIYPNPVVDRLTIQYNTTTDLESTKLVVTDVLGREIFSTPLEFENGEVEVDVTAMPNGAYIVSLINNKEVVAHAKLIKR